jgi:hypothetical protein
MWSLSVSAIAATDAASHAVPEDSGQAALALLLLIVVVVAWMGLREMVRRWRAPRA